MIACLGWGIFLVIVLAILCCLMPWWMVLLIVVVSFINPLIPWNQPDVDYDTFLWDEESVALDLSDLYDTEGKPKFLTYGMSLRLKIVVKIRKQH